MDPALKHKQKPFHSRVSKEMSEHLEKRFEPSAKTRFNGSILANRDHGSGLAGQITARGETRYHVDGSVWHRPRRTESS